MQRQTVDIIGDIFETMEVEFIINNITTISGDYKLETSCTWWLSIGCDVFINSIKYTIKEFIIDDYILVTGSVLPTSSSFIIPAPKYLHGTLKDARTEVTAEVDKELVYPLGYLKEVIRDRKNTDDESMIDREVDLRIFFINSANTDSWLTDDHYENVIYPMQSMVDLFMRKVRSSKLFIDELDYNCLPLVDISVDGEQEKSLFDSNVSGIENRLFALIREDLSCEKKCNCI